MQAVVFNINNKSPLLPFLKSMIQLNKKELAALDDRVVVEVNDRALEAYAAALKLAED